MNMMPGQPQDEHEQLVDHAAMFGDVVREPMVEVRRNDERQHAEHRHHQEHEAQKCFTTNLLRVGESVTR